MDIKSLKLAKFEDYGSKTSRKISLNKSFGFGFPPALYKEQSLFAFTHAKLYFDERQNVVGIQFVSDPGGERGYKLVTYGDGDNTGASFIARSFFNKYNIDPGKYHGKYDYFKQTLEDVGDVYLIELKEYDKKNKD